MFKKIFTLKFEEQPPYDSIIETLQAEQQKEILLGIGDNNQGYTKHEYKNTPIHHQFEWTKNHAAKSLLKNYMEDRKFGDGSSHSSINSFGI